MSNHFPCKDLESSNWNNETTIKKWLFWGTRYKFTPLKTNMSPESRWLEDVFPTEMVYIILHLSSDQNPGWLGQIRNKNYPVI